MRFACQPFIQSRTRAAALGSKLVRTNADLILGAPNGGAVLQHMLTVSLMAMVMAESQSSKAAAVFMVCRARLVVA